MCRARSTVDESYSCSMHVPSCLDSHRRCSALRLAPEVPVPRSGNHRRNGQPIPATGKYDRSLTPKRVRNRWMIKTSLLHVAFLGKKKLGSLIKGSLNAIDSRQRRSALRLWRRPTSPNRRHVLPMVEAYTLSSLATHPLYRDRATERLPYSS